MLGWSIKLFRVRGIQLSLHVTFLLLLAYYCQTGWNEGGITGVYWSVAQFLIIFGSVVLHELGHSFTAMRFGVGVRGILLMPIGGMAQFDHIPRKPLHELLITAAGPAVNFAIVALLWFAVDFPEGWNRGSGPLGLADVGRFLLETNLVLGIFNLYPAFPMDGGRIVRALLAFKLTYLNATFWAFVGTCILTPIGVLFALYEGNGLLAVLFLFIFLAGLGEYRGIKRQEQLEAAWREELQRRLEAEMQRSEPPPLDPTQHWEL